MPDSDYEPLSASARASEDPSETALERPAQSTPSQVETQHAKRDPLAALRYRDYQLYSLGGFFSALCSHMASVAVGWELYNRTDSPLALGLVGLVQALPVILLALPAGQVADRVSRKNIIFVATLLNAAALAGLALNSSHNGPLFWFYGWLLLSGIARAFEGIGNAF